MKNSVKIVNEAMINRGQHPINKFTKLLKKRCKKELRVTVKMRNGLLVSVYFREAKENCWDCGFYNTDGNNSFSWELDGESITSSDFDLIEFA